jgi:hypothetical protein
MVGAVRVSGAPMRRSKKSAAVIGDFGTTRGATLGDAQMRSSAPRHSCDASTTVRKCLTSSQSFARSGDSVTLSLAAALGHAFSPRSGQNHEM